jgi:4'-phosphopantetheinyl transferase EntD
MTWRELPPLQTDVAAQLPPLEALKLVASRISDCTDALLPEELPAIARARDRRAHEFATGRRLVRCAMDDLGVAACAVPRAEDRSPIWPAGLMGSITHANDLAIAAVARAGDFRGVGIDLEEPERITEPLFGKLFTESERARLDGVDPRLPGLMFSAKEAGYKAVNPSVGKFIGFQEAEVDVDWPSRTLRLRYIGDHAPNRIMSEGVGHFCFFERYVLTVFIIP